MTVCVLRPPEYTRIRTHIARQAGRKAVGLADRPTDRPPCGRCHGLAGWSSFLEAFARRECLAPRGAYHVALSGAGRRSELAGRGERPHEGAAKGLSREECVRRRPVRRQGGRGRGRPMRRREGRDRIGREGEGGEGGRERPPPSVTLLLQRPLRRRALSNSTLSEGGDRRSSKEVNEKRKEGRESQLGRETENRGQINRGILGNLCSRGRITTRRCW